MEWLEPRQFKPGPDGPKNSEEAAQMRIGKELYEKIILEYGQQETTFSNEIVAILAA